MESELAKRASVAPPRQVTVEEASDVGPKKVVDWDVVSRKKRKALLDLAMTVIRLDCDHPYAEYGPEGGTSLPAAEIGDMNPNKRSWRRAAPQDRIKQNRAPEEASSSSQAAPCDVDLEVAAFNRKREAKGVQEKPEAVARNPMRNPALAKIRNYMAVVDQIISEISTYILDGIGTDKYDGVGVAEGLAKGLGKVPRAKSQFDEGTRAYLMELIDSKPHEIETDELIWEGIASQVVKMHAWCCERIDDLFDQSVQGGPESSDAPDRPMMPHPNSALESCLEQELRRLYSSKKGTMKVYIHDVLRTLRDIRGRMTSRDTRRRKTEDLKGATQVLGAPESKTSDDTGMQVDDTAMELTTMRRENTTQLQATQRRCKDLLEIMTGIPDDDNEELPDVEDTMERLEKCRTNFQKNLKPVSTWLVTDRKQREHDTERAMKENELRGTELKGVKSTFEAMMILDHGSLQRDKVKGKLLKKFEAYRKEVNMLLDTMPSEWFAAKKEKSMEEEKDARRTSLLKKEAQRTLRELSEMSNLSIEKLEEYFPKMKKKPGPQGAGGSNDDDQTHQETHANVNPSEQNWRPRTEEEKMVLSNAKVIKQLRRTQASSEHLCNRINDNLEFKTMKLLERESEQHRKTAVEIAKQKRQESMRRINATKAQLAKQKLAVQENLQVSQKDLDRWRLVQEVKSLMAQKTALEKENANIEETSNQIDTEIQGLRNVIFKAEQTFNELLLTPCTVDVQTLQLTEDVCDGKPPEENPELVNAKANAFIESKKELPAAAKQSLLQNASDVSMRIHQSLSMQGLSGDDVQNRILKAMGSDRPKKKRDNNRRGSLSGVSIQEKDDPFGEAMEQKEWDRAWSAACKGFSIGHFPSPPNTSVEILCLENVIDRIGQQEAKRIEPLPRYHDGLAEFGHHLEALQRAEERLEKYLSATNPIEFWEDEPAVLGIAWRDSLVSAARGVGATLQALQDGYQASVALEKEVGGSRVESEREGHKLGELRPFTLGCVLKRSEWLLVTRFNSAVSVLETLRQGVNLHRIAVTMMQMYKEAVAKNGNFSYKERKYRLGTLQRPAFANTILACIKTLTTISGDLTKARLRPEGPTVDLLTALGTADQIPEGKFPDMEDTVKFYRKHCGTTVTASMYATVRDNELMLNTRLRAELFAQREALENFRKDESAPVEELLDLGTKGLNILLRNWRLEVALYSEVTSGSFFRKWHQEMQRTLIPGIGADGDAENTEEVLTASDIGRLENFAPKLPSPGQLDDWAAALEFERTALSLQLSPQERAALVWCLGPRIMWPTEPFILKECRPRIFGNSGAKAPVRWGFRSIGDMDLETRILMEKFDRASEVKVSELFEMTIPALEGTDGDEFWETGGAGDDDDEADKDDEEDNSSQEEGEEEDKESSALEAVEEEGETWQDGGSITVAQAVSKPPSAAGSVRGKGDATRDVAGDVAGDVDDDNHEVMRASAESFHPPSSRASSHKSSHSQSSQLEKEKKAANKSNRMDTSVLMRSRANKGRVEPEIPETVLPPAAADRSLQFVIAVDEDSEEDNDASVDRADFNSLSQSLQSRPSQKAKLRNSVMKKKPTIETSISEEDGQISQMPVMEEEDETHHDKRHSLHADHLGVVDALSQLKPQLGAYTSEIENIEDTDDDRAEELVNQANQLIELAQKAADEDAEEIAALLEDEDADLESVEKLQTLLDDAQLQLETLSMSVQDASLRRQRKRLSQAEADFAVVHEDEPAEQTHQLVKHQQEQRLDVLGKMCDNLDKEAEVINKKQKMAEDEKMKKTAEHSQKLQAIKDMSEGKQPVDSAACKSAWKSHAALKRSGMKTRDLKAKAVKAQLEKCNLQLQDLGTIMDSGAENYPDLDETLENALKEHDELTAQLVEIEGERVKEAERDAAMVAELLEATQQIGEEVAMDVDTARSVVHSGEQQVLDAKAKFEEVRMEAELQHVALMEKREQRKATKDAKHASHAKDAKEKVDQVDPEIAARRIRGEMRRKAVVQTKVEAIESRLKHVRQSIYVANNSEEVDEDEREERLEELKTVELNLQNQLNENKIDLMVVDTDHDLKQIQLQRLQLEKKTQEAEEMHASINRVRRATKRLSMMLQASPTKLLGSGMANRLGSKGLTRLDSTEDDKTEENTEKEHPLPSRMPTGEAEPPKSTTLEGLIGGKPASPSVSDKSGSKQGSSSGFEPEKPGSKPRTPQHETRKAPTFRSSVVLQMDTQTLSDSSMDVRRIVQESVASTLMVDVDQVNVVSHRQGADGQVHINFEVQVPDEAPEAPETGEAPTAPEAPEAPEGKEDTPTIAELGHTNDQIESTEEQSPEVDKVDDAKVGDGAGDSHPQESPKAPRVSHDGEEMTRDICLDDLVPDQTSAGQDTDAAPDQDTDTAGADVDANVAAAQERRASSHHFVGAEAPVAAPAKAMKGSLVKPKVSVVQPNTHDSASLVESFPSTRRNNFLTRCQNMSGDPNLLLAQIQKRAGAQATFQATLSVTAAEFQSRDGQKHAKLGTSRASTTVNDRVQEVRAFITVNDTSLMFLPSFTSSAQMVLAENLQVPVEQVSITRINKTTTQEMSELGVKEDEDSEVSREWIKVSFVVKVNVEEPNDSTKSKTMNRPQSPSGRRSPSPSRPRSPKPADAPSGSLRRSPSPRRSASPHPGDSPSKTRDDLQKRQMQAQNSKAKADELMKHLTEMQTDSTKLSKNLKAQLLKQDVEFSRGDDLRMYVSSGKVITAGMFSKEKEKIRKKRRVAANTNSIETAAVVVRPPTHVIDEAVKMQEIQGREKVVESVAVPGEITVPEPQQALEGSIDIKSEQPQTEKLGLEAAADAAIVPDDDPSSSVAVAESNARSSGYAEVEAAIVLTNAPSLESPGLALYIQQAIANTFEVALNQVPIVGISKEAAEDHRIELWVDFQIGSAKSEQVAKAARLLRLLDGLRDDAKPFVAEFRKVLEKNGIRPDGGLDARVEAGLTERNMGDEHEDEDVPSAPIEISVPVPTIRPASASVCKKAMVIKGAAAPGTDDLGHAVQVAIESSLGLGAGLCVITSLRSEAPTDKIPEEGDDLHVEFQIQAPVQDGEEGGVESKLQELQEDSSKFISNLSTEFKEHNITAVGKLDAELSEFDRVSATRISQSRADSKDSAHTRKSVRVSEDMVRSQIVLKDTVPLATKGFSRNVQAVVAQCLEVQPEQILLRGFDQQNAEDMPAADNHCEVSVQFDVRVAKEQSPDKVIRKLDDMQQNPDVLVQRLKQQESIGSRKSTKSNSSIVSHTKPQRQDKNAKTRESIAAKQKESLEKEQALKDMCQDIIVQQEMLAKQAENIDMMSASDKLDELAKLEEETRMNPHLSEERKNHILGGISQSTAKLKSHQDALAKERKQVAQARIAAWKSGARALLQRKQNLEENIDLIKGVSTETVLERAIRRRELDAVEDSMEEMAASADKLQINQAEESARKAVSDLREVRASLKDQDQSQPMARRRLTTVENKAAFGFVEVERAKLERERHEREKFERQAQRQVDGYTDFKDFLTSVIDPNIKAHGLETDSKKDAAAWNEKYILEGVWKNKDEMVNFFDQLDPDGKLRIVAKELEEQNIQDPQLIKDLLLIAREEGVQEAQDLSDTSLETTIAHRVQIEDKEIQRLQRQLDTWKSTGDIVDVDEEENQTENHNWGLTPSIQLKSQMATKQNARAQAVLELEEHRLGVLRRRFKFKAEVMRVKVAQAEATGNQKVAQEAKKAYEEVSKEIDERQLAVEEAKIGLEAIQLENLEAGIDVFEEEDLNATDDEDEDEISRKPSKQDSAKPGKHDSTKPGNIASPKPGSPGSHKSVQEQKQELSERKRLVQVQKMNQAQHKLQSEEVHLQQEKQNVEKLEDELDSIKRQLAELEDAEDDDQDSVDEDEAKEQRMKAKEEKKKTLMSRSQQAEAQVNAARANHEMALQQYEGAKKEVKTLRKEGKSQLRVRMSGEGGPTVDGEQKSDVEAQQESKDIEEEVVKSGNADVHRSSSEEKLASTTSTRELVQSQSHEVQLGTERHEVETFSDDATLRTCFKRWRHFVDVSKRVKARQSRVSQEKVEIEEKAKPTCISRGSIHAAQARRRQTLNLTRKSQHARMEEENNQMGFDLAAGLSISTGKQGKTRPTAMVDPNSVGSLDEANMSLTMTSHRDSSSEPPTARRSQRKSFWAAQDRVKAGRLTYASSPGLTQDSFAGMGSKIAAEFAKDGTLDKDAIEMSAALEEAGFSVYKYTSNTTDPESTASGKGQRQSFGLEKATFEKKVRKSHVSKTEGSRSVSPEPRSRSEPPPEKTGFQLLDADKLKLDRLVLYKKGWTRVRDDGRPTSTPPRLVQDATLREGQRFMARTLSGRTIPQPVGFTMSQPVGMHTGRSSPRLPSPSPWSLGASSRPGRGQFHGAPLGGGDVLDEGAAAKSIEDPKDGSLRNLLRQPSARGAPQTPEKRVTPPSATGSSPTPPHSLRNTGERWLVQQPPTSGGMPVGDLHQHPSSWGAELLTSTWEEMSRPWTPQSEVSDISTATPPGLHDLQDNSDNEDSMSAPRSQPWILHMASRQAAAKVYLDIVGSQGWKEREMRFIEDEKRKGFSYDDGKSDDFQLPPLSQVRQPMNVHPKYAEVAARKAHDLPAHTSRLAHIATSDAYLKRRSDEIAAQYGLKGPEGWEPVKPNRQLSQTSTQAPSSNAASASTLGQGSRSSLPGPASKGSLSVASIWDECLSEVKKVSPPKKVQDGQMSKYALTLVDVHPPNQDKISGIDGLPESSSLQNKGQRISKPTAPMSGRPLASSLRQDRIFKQIQKDKFAVLNSTK